MAASNELHLVLKGKWFDMIQSGEKKVEYRDLTEYWWKRLTGFMSRNGILVDQSEYGFPYMFVDRADFFFHPIYVVFHRGYTNQTCRYRILMITPTSLGNPLWGAEPCKNYFAIGFREDSKAELFYLKTALIYMDAMDPRREAFQSRIYHLEWGGDPELNKIDYSKL